MDRSELPLHTVAAKAGLSPVALDEFLTSERTLPSDAVDRLAAAIRLKPPHKTTEEIL